MKQKVMITAVGNRDPYFFEEKTITEICTNQRSNNNGNEETVYYEKKIGPIVNAVDTLCPQMVYLLYTDSKNIHCGRKMSSYVDETKEFLEKEYTSRSGQCQLTVKAILLKYSDENSPLDLEYLTNAFKDFYNNSNDYNANEHLPSREDNDFYTVISSGTPHMQTAFIIMKDRGIIPGELYNVLEIPNENGDMLEPVDMKYLKESSLLKDTQSLLERFLFKAAADNMETLAATAEKEENKKKYNLLKDIFLAYHMQTENSQDFETAKDILTHVKDEIENNNFNDITPSLIEQQIKALEGLNKYKTQDPTKIKIPSELFLIDLYHIAERNFKKGQYLTTTSIALRGYEGFLMRIIDKIKEKCKQSSLGSNDSPEKKSTINTMEGFIKKQDENLSDEIKSSFDRERTQRNESILGHGLEGIGKETAERFLQDYKNLLINCMLDGQSKEIDNYPFRTGITDIYIKELDNIINSLDQEGGETCGNT